MTRIEQLMAEYEKVKCESLKKQDYCAQQISKAEISDLFKEFVNYANQLKGYSSDIKVELDLINGLNDYEKFIICFSPYNITSDKDSVLTGYWKNDAIDGTYSCYSFNPDYNHNSRIDSTKNEKKFYLPALNFVFSQIYGQKSYLLKLVEDQIVSDLTKMIEFEKKLAEVVSNI